MVKPASTIWRDYVDDGIPSSGPHKPKKSEVREWAADLEAKALPASTAADAGDIMVVKDDGSGWIKSRARGSYLGQVASHCGACQAVGTTNLQMNSRSRHFARDKITSLQLRFPNWYISSSSEEGSGGTIVVTASIEYPEGQFTQVKWSGSSSVAIANNTNSALSDPVSIEIPDGAEFFVRSWQTSPTAIVWSPQRDLASGERCSFNPSGLTDLTMGGVIPDSGFPVIYRPCAIVAQTKKPSLLIIGDSREFGVQDAPNAYSDMGYIQRSVSTAMGVINVARSGESASEFLASRARRMELAPYCSHVALHHGINDLLAGASAATTISSLESIIALFTQPVWLATIEPVSTGTWTSDAGQTVDATTNTPRITVNTAIRAGLSGAAGYFEIADVLESARNSGKWRNYAGTALTTDGIHANPLGNRIVQESGAVDPRVFFAVPDQKPKFATPQQVAAGSASGVPIDAAALAKRPKFRAVKGGSTWGQTITSATQTNIVFGFLLLDHGGYFDTTTSRFNPPKGVYQLKAQASISTGIVDQAVAIIRILKNGVSIAQKNTGISGTGVFTADVSTIADAAFGDYFEVAIEVSGAGDKTVSGVNTLTFFEGYAI